MSSTSAVAVLAQGLRELRDFAEGPDGEELQQRTGLTAQQIQQALGGEELPTREVTLALVEAWEGDVEAWREYWGQISELAGEEDGGHGRKAEAGTPAPPEPSIITPIPEAEGAAESESDGEGGPDGESGAGAEESAQDAADADADAEAAAVVEEEPEEAEAVEVEAEQGQEQGQAEGAEQDAASAEGDDSGAAAGAGEAKSASEASGANSAGEKAIPAQRTAASSAVLEGVVVAGGTAKPVKKSMLGRVGIPIVVFAVGVGVGAFGDHALNSKQSSTASSASVPAASAASSSKPSHSAGSSASSPAATPGSTGGGASGSASSPDTAGGTGSSTSASSTVAAGTVLGTYINIQLASGYSVNFLTDPYHPAAGTSNGPDTMGFFAGSFVDGRFYADRVAILDSTDTGSYTSCLNDTRYQHDVLLSQVAAGGSFCITTSTGHVVLVTVRRMPSSTDANPYAVLDVTVWQGN